MFKGFVSSAFILLISCSLSLAEQPWMSASWTKEFCSYWNEHLQTTMAEWSKYNVNKEKGYKTIAFYRQDCNPKIISEVEIKNENGKAVCIYGGAQKDPHPEFTMYATTQNWKSLAAGNFGFMNIGMFSKMTFIGSKGEAMQFIAPFKAFLIGLGKVPYSESCP
ncbi:MAG: SCP2 sterol-binding domain-containing protein [Desulfurella sp.]|uniref:SCP2 sterol-binding domain-containing protein n=1 Tax=Desulfurella TaxID=33001 RepID=UPI000CAE26F0|nr:SCP2 sterol-binding domain-containing protein [Desulfurella multipotens]PMP65526.1 MAG: SCP-2 sterol transfer family protein [Desulfurella multipotens]